jgi:hypothetical protein
MILFPGGCEPGAPLGHAPCDHPYRLIKKRSRRSSAYLLVANRVRNRTSSSSSLSLLSPQYFTDDPCASLRLNAVDLVSRIPRLPLQISPLLLPQQISRLPLRSGGRRAGAHSSRKPRRLRLRPAS